MNKKRDNLMGTPVYAAKGRLYLNLTNRCPSDCSFCLAKFSDSMFGYNLRLIKEPPVDEVLHQLELALLADPAQEVAFVGLGEPTMRFDDLLKIVEWCRLRLIPTRLVTNGLGRLINPGRNLPAELAAAGLDAVSISLVADNAEVYNQICRPLFSKAFREVLAFGRDCLKLGIRTELTAVELPGVDIESCRVIAKKLGAGFRARRLITADSQEAKL